MQSDAASQKDTQHSGDYAHDKPSPRRLNGDIPELSHDEHDTAHLTSEDMHIAGEDEKLPWEAVADLRCEAYRGDLGRARQVGQDFRFLRYLCSCLLVQFGLGELAMSCSGE